MNDPKPYYKASHKAWYVNLNGKNIRLHRDEEEARIEYHKLMLTKNETARLATRDARVNDLIATYMQSLKKSRGEGHGTYQWYDRYLGSFSTHLAARGKSRLLVRDMKPHHVTSWVDEKFRNVSQNTRGGAITAIKRVFSWAVDEGYIDSSPIARMKKPGYVPRGDAAYISDAMWERIVEVMGEKKLSGNPFLDYLTVLKETGCRPQEIKLVEAKHFCTDDRLWKFSASESKGGKLPRIVPLTEKAAEICQKLAKRHPTGPLFRNSNGDPWTNFSIACRFRRIETKTGFKLCAYSFRHTFATNKILEGVDLITLMHMMGHKDLTMLSKVYQHVQRAETIKKSAKGKQGRSAHDPVRRGTRVECE